MLFQKVTMRALSLVAFTLLSLPIFGQAYLAGNWTPLRHEDQAERGQGPELGDYLGLPINDAARLRADSWSASRMTLPEQQCRVHSVTYIYRGPNHLRIWEEKDPKTQQVVAIKNYISTYEQTRTIWMDGRPHPSEYAAHTFMGFSTGEWQGDILTVRTTHIKQGFIRRNGLVQSDLASMVEHFIRHGNILTHVSVVTDPVYTTEPLIKSEDFQLDELDQGSWLWPCEPVEEIANRKKTEVPNYLPGANPYLLEFPSHFNVSAQATRGGAETMYPEYQAKLKTPGGPPPPASGDRAAPVPPADTAEIEVLPVQGNIYVIATRSGNITVQTGPLGVLVVDTGTAALSEKVLAEVRKLSDKPLRYIINTDLHPEHTGGNETLARYGGGEDVRNIRNTPGDLEGQIVKILAHDNVLQRMNNQPPGQPEIPFISQPGDTYFGGSKDLYFNGESIQLLHQPAAHTDGDTMVYFRRSDVISAGDIYVTDKYPMIDLANGGSLQGVIDGLNRLLDLAIPEHHEEGGTLIIPGRGRISDEFDVLEYRDMVTIIRDRIQDMIRKGMTLAQVKAARPTRDYDPQYGANADTFVEAAYRSLTKTK
jgi:cyclase